jgi:thiamine-monophosphate kinase
MLMASDERVLSEDELVPLLRELTAAAAPSALLIGIGDDAAVWQPSRSHRSVITTDVLVEGVHFTRDAMSAFEVGHRALASNLSDIAAMGARPVLATIGLGVPAGSSSAWILDAYRGIAELATRTRCAIAGGDIVRAPGFVFSITVVGEVRASNLKTRSGMQPGDTIAVTGPLGASRAGLLIALDRPDLAADPAGVAVLRAFRTPEPRLREGRFLAASRNVRAMMDGSDGLSTDIARLAAASGTGAVIDDVPADPDARTIAERTGNDVAAWARDGGEDFELIVAVATHAFHHLAGRFRSHTGRELLRIGYATDERGVRFADGTPVEPAGWDHFGEH